MEQNSREREGAESVPGVVARAEPLELRRQVTGDGFSEMFNSMFHQFEEDPFFREPFRAHQEHMNKMMRHSSNNQVPFSDGFREMTGSLVPFDSFHSMIAEPMDPFKHTENISSMMKRMFDGRGIFDEQPSNSNGHSFSSSSVKSYSKLGDKPAKLFEATSQTIQAPGGIKEIRKTVRNSDTGEDKFTIGHHIRDRGHVIERSKNKQSGASEVNQEFINVDENEAGAFDQEWENHVASFRRDGSSARPSCTWENMSGKGNTCEIQNRNTHRKQ